MFEVSDPDATTLTVTGLVPFMLYKLRIIANNVVGASSPSEPTKEFQTIQAPPAHPPYNVTVRAMSATELRVRWIVSTFGVPFITFRKADFFLNNQQDALIITIFFCYKTLHVSGIVSTHHQEFSTVHLALTSFMQVSDDLFQADSGWKSDSAWKRSS